MLTRFFDRSQSKRHVSQLVEGNIVVLSNGQRAKLAYDVRNMSVAYVRPYMRGSITIINKEIVTIPVTMIVGIWLPNADPIGVLHG